MFLLKIFITIIFFLLFPHFVLAEELKQATIVHPVRGSDFWNYDYKILDTPKNQYDLLNKNKLPATWLVRYDALLDVDVVSFLKSLNSQQEVGLLLEITPKFAQGANIKYNESENWHYAKSLFLVGYTQEDRKKLIDTAVSRYEEIFNFYPKSVGAWWIDAFSLNYLHEKYGIETNLDVADQHSTDQYQIWGQYWSTPFYPAKLNALMPAQSKEQKIGVVTIQWATRDPYNSYGSGVNDSTYSVQVNDYLLHKLDHSYFEKLLDIYPQITVGLENDFSWEKFGESYTKQIEVLIKRKDKGLLSLKTMRDYAKYYKDLYPEISPNVLIQAEDPLQSGGKVVWYQTPKYRVGWFYGAYGSVIRDLRQYNDSVKEQCFDKPCQGVNLSITTPDALDEVTFSTRWLIDEGKIFDSRVNKNKDLIEIIYHNQAGTERLIKFLPNDIEVNGKIQPISFAILNAINLPQEQKKEGALEFNNNVNILKIVIDFIPNLGKFSVLTVFFFLLPGWVISRKFITAIPLGWSIFTLVSFILGYLSLLLNLSTQLNFILWGIPIFSLIFIKKVGSPKISSPKISLSLVILFLTIFLGSISWLLTTVKNGLMYSFGLGYWGPNGHDAIWHLALISELQKNFPPQNPVFAGELLTNYHYFFNLLVANSGSLLGIDIQDLLFRLFPLTLSVLAGVLVYKTTIRIFKDIKTGILATFFLYFGGSFGWIVSYFRDKSLGGESLFWSQQAISTLLNPPFAISLVILLAGLYIFIDLTDQQKERKWPMISLVLLWGTLIEFKVYAGILVLLALGVVATHSLLFRKGKFFLWLFLSCLFLSLVVFLPNNLKGASLLIFSPLWLVNSMVDFNDRLGWQRLSLARQAYFATGNLLKLVGAEVLGLGIFLLGNLGTRILMILSLKNIFSQNLQGNKTLVFLTTVWFAGILIPLLFIQKGNNWNIIQFFYYSSVVTGIFAAVSLTAIWNKLGQKVGLVITGVIILLTLPTTFNTLSQYLPARPPARLSVAEEEALRFLRNQPSGTILTLAYDPLARNNFLEPLPLSAYTSTAYVSAFSKHPTFLEDTINLEILGIDYRGRLNLQRDFLKIREKSKMILRENNISYVYILKSSGFEEDEGAMGIKKIFENSEIKVFKRID